MRHVPKYWINMELVTATALPSGIKRTHRHYSTGVFDTLIIKT